MIRLLAIVVGELANGILRLLYPDPWTKSDFEHEEALFGWFSTTVVLFFAWLVGAVFVELGIGFTLFVTGMVVFGLLCMKAVVYGIEHHDL